MHHFSTPAHIGALRARYFLGSEKEQSGKAPARREACNRKRRGFLIPALLSFALTTFVPVALAQTNVYWDTNGNTAGTGNAGGTWSNTGNSNWSSSSSGGSTSSWSNRSGGDDDAIAIFSAGTNGTGTFTVTVSGAIPNVGGITFQEGNVTVAGGTLTLSQNATFRTTVSGVISSSITDGGSSFELSKAGSQTLTLSGNNTFNGGTTLSAGTLNINSATALGTGRFTLEGGNFDNTSGAALTLSNNNLQSWNSNFSFLGTNDLNLGTGAVTLGGSRIADVDGSNLTVGGAIADGASTFALTKTGAGTLMLSGNNTYDGTTTVSAGTLTLAGNNSGASGALTLTAGTLNLNHASAAGAGTLSLNGGTLNNTSGAAITLATNNAQSWGGNFTFAGSDALDLGTGAVTLTGNRIVTVDASTLTVGGALGGGVFTLTKAGAGALVLAGNNTYDGVTTVAAGTLTLSGNNSAAAGGIVLNAGTLNLNHLNAAGTGTLTLNGGTLDNTSGSALTLATNNAQTWGGNFAFTGTHNLNLGAGAVTLTGTRTVTANAGNLTVGGAIADGGSGFGLTKAGGGTLTLDGSASNTYSGPTTINAGTLALAKSSGATAVSGNITLGDGSGTATLQLGAAHQIADSAAVTMTAGGTPTFNLNGFSERIGSLASTNTAAAVQLGSPASATSLTVGDTTSTAFAGVISGGPNASLVKEGSGSLTLSGNSTFSGPVAINNGTVVMQHNAALGAGAAGTTVASGATLKLDNNLAAAQNGPLTLAGTGASGAGALAGGTGNNRWANNITLAADTTITNNGSGFLALGVTSTTYNRALLDPSGTPADNHTLSLGNHTLTLSGSNTIYANARIAGAGNVTIDMASAATQAWFTANMNTFTGTTTVKNGTFVLASIYNTYPNDPAHPNFFGLNGPLVIGDGAGLANTARVNISAGTLYDEMMNFNTTVTLHQDGQFNLLAAQSLSGVTFNGGAINLGSTGGLYLNGDVTVNASAGNTATITGTGTSTLSLTIHQGPVPAPNATRTFNVIGGVGNTSDLTINATINNGSLVKTGAGTMTILNSNSGGYEGTTTVNNGVLNIQHGSALGQADMTNATATIVNGNGTTNGTLQLQGGITVANEKLTLNSTGFNQNGALQNVSGNNIWSGPIVLGSDSRVQSDANTLTLSGAITSSNNSTLDVRGSGNTTLSGAIGTGSGGLTKSGTGTLVVSGNNTYSGATTINQGVLSLQHNNGLGSTTAGTTVAGTGAALHLDNTAIGGGANALNTLAEPLALIGTGVSGTGALRNVSGNNTFAGPISVATPTLLAANPGTTSSLITANSGTTLTLAGGISSTAGSSHTLTIGTAAQNGHVTISGDVSTGAMSLTKAGTGTLTFTSASNTVGQTHLNAGTLSVGGSATLNTAELDASAGTTLAIASGGTVVANYASGVTNFSGIISGGGTFQKDGAGTLRFNGTSFSAGSGSMLTLNGGSLSLLGSQITFDTIHITGNTILDFNNSAGTFLSSANLIIDAGVTVTVNNWVSVANNAAQSTTWYLRSGPGTGGVLNNSITLGATDLVGGSGLGQIVFNNFNGLTTTWVSSGVSNGWFHHEIRPTPEPATYGALLLGGCLGLIGWRRYLRRRA